jgi:hypothetical protein
MGRIWGETRNNASEQEDRETGKSEVFNRIRQLKCVGNAIVPSVAAIFLYAILQDIERNSK